MEQLRFESLVPSNTPVLEKDKLLLFMRHSPIKATSPRIAKDWLTGESIPCEICVYEACGYWWTSVDVWHYNAYNFRLPDGFVAIAREHYLDHLKRKHKGGITMTIEESIKKDPTRFKAVLETKVPDVQAAMNDLSAKLDVIFGGAIKEYCESEGVEANVDDIPTYKTMNKLITGKLDFLISEHVKEKRKDL